MRSKNLRFRLGDSPVGPELFINCEKTAREKREHAVLPPSPWICANFERWAYLELSLIDARSDVPMSSAVFFPAKRISETDAFPSLRLTIVASYEEA